MRVVHREVAHDDGHGQGDRQHTGQRTQRTDKHADVRLGRHVAVPDGGHRDQRPPQPERDAVEVVVRVDLDALGVVDEAGEYHDAEHEEKHQQRQLLGGRPEGLDQDL